VAVPSFVLGPVLVLLFAIGLGWLPVSGDDGPASVVLPALTLAAGMGAVLLRLTRVAVLEALGADHLRTARAKGAGPVRVTFVHALRTALPPVVTVIGLQAGALLAGAIVTETIFAWPGVGRLVVQAIGARDYPLVQGCVLAIGLAYVAVNLVTDLVLAGLDPRLRDEA
jgi:peptide/nickel transport system permease protein